MTRREALLVSAGAAAFVALRHPMAAVAGSRTVHAPFRFEMVGLRDAAAGTLVRARRDGGAWSPWVAVGAHRDPVWTGPADELQIRGRGRPEFLRLPVNARSSARAQASQVPGAPAMVMRPGWGGDSRPPKSPPEYGEVQAAFVHHTVSTNDYAPEDSASIVLGICQYHQDSNRWNDIGYNFLVDKYGQIFEGRAGGIDQAVIGAQAQGYNSVSTGIACIGDFSALPNADAGIEAVARLIAWKLPLHGVPVAGEVTVTSAGGSANRYAAGTPVVLQRISGHRDGNKTACPGDGLYGQLPRIRERAGQLATPLSVLSIKAQSRKVRHPAPLALSGTLRFSDGAPPAGAPIQIQHQTAGAAWSEIATTNVGEDGNWNAVIAPPGSGAYRAYFPGDASHPPLEAAAIAVRVVPKVTIGLSTRRAAPGTKVEVTGTVGPTWPSKVPLVLEIKRRGRWRRVQRKRINVRRGAYASFVRPRTPGLYRISIEVPGNPVRRLLRVTTS